MINKTVVILANSVKHNQHCVAGKCIETGEWIRPVSTPEGGELSNEQSTFTNPHGKFIVKPMQKIIMDLDSHVPLIQQPENYLISPSLWRQNYRITDAELLQLLDNPDSLWGQDSRVPYSLIVQNRDINQSLYLVKVDDLHLSKNDEGKRRATFSYKNINYELPVTDPNFDNIQRNEIEIKDIICVSLGENFNGYCYKLLATVF